jgi:hypothetical protein
MRTSELVLRGMLVVIALSVPTACEQGTTTEPKVATSPRMNATLPLIPVSTPYPGAQVPGQVVLCKALSSPSGTYFFNISTTQTQSGDQTASFVQLTPGECAIIFNRVADGVGLMASVTITESVSNNSSFQVDHIATEEPANLGGNRTITGTPTVTVRASSYHGALVTYFNAPNTLPRMTSYPGTQNPGDVKVCKAASSPAGSYSFFFNFSNTAGGDKFPQSNLTLSPGQCAIVFQRFTPQATSASVTITENIPFGAGFFVDHIVRADESGTITQSGPGNSITTTENASTGSVVTFFNAPNVALPTPTDNSLVANKVKLCTDPSSAGGQFFINVSGAVAGDQTTNGATLSPGQCAVIFVRPTPQASHASVTVTETSFGVLVDKVVTTRASGSTTTMTTQVTTTTNGDGVVINYYSSLFPRFTDYPGTVTPGQLKVCKDASSPPGRYEIDFAGLSWFSGDEVTFSAVLSPGQCAILFRRTLVQPGPTTFTVVEFVSNSAPYTVDHVVRQDGSGTSTVAGGSATTSIDLNVGAVLTFFNVDKAAGLPQLTDASQVPGNVKICVDHSSPATNYFFFISTGGAVAGDQTSTSVTLTSGQCGLVFVRTHAAPSPATIFITESIGSNSPFNLHKVIRVDGAGTASLPGPQVSTLNNGGTGSVVTFFNIQK